MSSEVNHRNMFMHLNPLLEHTLSSGKESRKGLNFRILLIHNPLLYSLSTPYFTVEILANHSWALGCCHSGTWIQLGVVSCHQRASWPIGEQERVVKRCLGYEWIMWGSRLRRSPHCRVGGLIQSGLGQVVSLEA